jgi:hypothetical protein
MAEMADNGVPPLKFIIIDNILRTHDPNTLSCVRIIDIIRDVLYSNVELVPERMINLARFIDNISTRKECEEVKELDSFINDIYANVYPKFKEYLLVPPNIKTPSQYPLYQDDIEEIYENYKQRKYPYWDEDDLPAPIENRLSPELLFLYSTRQLGKSYTKKETIALYKYFHRKDTDKNAIESNNGMESRLMFADDRNVLITDNAGTVVDYNAPVGRDALYSFKGRSNCRNWVIEYKSPNSMQRFKMAKKVKSGEEKDPLIIKFITIGFLY